MMWREIVSVLEFKTQSQESAMSVTPEDRAFLVLFLPCLKFWDQCLILLPPPGGSFISHSSLFSLI